MPRRDLKLGQRFEDLELDTEVSGQGSHRSMKWFMQPRKAGFNNGLPRNLTQDQALRYYTEANWGSLKFGALNAVENLHSGFKAFTTRFVVWGEEISDKELFRRILKGEVELQKEEA